METISLVVPVTVSRTKPGNASVKVPPIAIAIEDDTFSSTRTLRSSWFISSTDKKLIEVSIRAMGGLEAIISWFISSEDNKDDPMGGLEAIAVETVEADIFNVGEFAGRNVFGNLISST